MNLTPNKRIKFADTNGNVLTGEFLYYSDLPAHIVVAIGRNFSMPITIKESAIVYQKANDWEEELEEKSDSSLFRDDSDPQAY